jgi:hypothetical protein
MRAPPRWIPALVSLVWAAWILYLGTDDRRRVVGFSDTPSEALQHIVAFAVLGALVMATVRRRPWMVFGLVALGGVVGEFAQLASSDRTFSVSDMVFSVTGAAIGVAAVRRTGWRTTIALVSVTGLLIAAAPLVLELSDDEYDASFPDACSAPPPPADGRPETVFAADFGAGVGDALPIRIEDPTTAEVRERLLEADELSVAVEFSTTSLDQGGPARLFTISGGSGPDQVDFHLGVEDDGLSVRLRTSCDIFNSIVVPDVVVAGTRHRAVVTWGGGSLDVWVDGRLEQSVSLPWGDLERWDPTYPIIVGDEEGGGRRFDGTVYSVTMWDRALDESDIVSGAPT